MIRVGIVGLGYIARIAYLPLLGADPRVEIVGISDLRAEAVERYGQQYRIPGRYRRLDDLLALRPDVMFVHTSTESHTEVVTRCLDAGIDVYVDKPLADSWAEAKALADHAAASGLLLAVGVNRRFAQHVRAARAAVPDPVIVTTTRHRTEYNHLPLRLMMFNDLLHSLDLLCWLLGDEAEIVSSTVVTDGHGRLSHALGTLAGPTAHAQFVMARHVGVDRESLVLHGSERLAEVTDLDRTALFVEGRHSTVAFGMWDSLLERRGFVGMIDHVLACLGRPAECEIAAERVLTSHRIAEELLARHRA
jgi:virulence factor